MIAFAKLTDGTGADCVKELAADIGESGSWQPAPLADETADDYFARLIDSGELEAAARFVAARLGPRRAVWWGSLCVWEHLQTSEQEPADAATVAVDAAVTWCLDQAEDHRHAANDAAAKVGLKTPAGALAAAAFWSAGSVSLPGRPEVAPPPGVAPKLVANAVLMAAADPAARVRRQRLLQSLRMAAEVLAGQTPWITDTGEAPGP